MPVCRDCKRTMTLIEVADPELYNGTEVTACADCAAHAAADLRALRPAHWTDRARGNRHETSRLTESNRLPPTTVELAWQLCTPCRDGLPGRWFATMKRDGKRVKWMQDLPAEPVTNRLCDCCERRGAAIVAAVRIVDA